MANILAGIGSLASGGLFTGISTLINTIRGKSPEDAAKLQELAAKYQEDILNADVQMQQTASANIQADAKSGDKFTQRARPSFMYIVEVILVCNYIVFPLLNRPPPVLPEPLFWLFGSAVLGYTGARSWEKYQGRTS
jgi:predicted PurR-regulated permease PerM